MQLHRIISKVGLHHLCERGGHSYWSCFVQADEFSVYFLLSAGVLFVYFLAGCMGCVLSFQWYLCGCRQHNLSVRILWYYLITLSLVFTRILDIKFFSWTTKFSDSVQLTSYQNLSSLKKMSRLNDSQPSLCLRRLFYWIVGFMGMLISI